MPDSRSKAPASARAFPHAQFKAIFDAALDAELTVTPLRLGGGWRFSAFVRDLTESKAAERRLAAQYSVTRPRRFSWWETRSLDNLPPSVA